MIFIFVAVVVAVAFIVFLTVCDAIQTKGYEYNRTNEGKARLLYLLSLSEEDLKKEPLYDRIFVSFLKRNNHGQTPVSVDDEETTIDDEDTDLPTFKEYKEWQAERPDLKTWREYKEWKLLKEENQKDADDGDA